MKLLFDENLSPRLTSLLADVYPDALHVHTCGLEAADDRAVWEFAKERGFAIVSKDSDFQRMSLLRGFPPKVIWLRASNCSTAQIEFILRTAASVVVRFLEQSRDGSLTIGKPKKKS
ncbi:MAG TPA: DUF5615 family PIN-like protein [Candidatus Acidoferrum sp.]|nr:DUF5615 family PIN-like protein [Candidatus Acidoferrum sp.]